MNASVYSNTLLIGHTNLKVGDRTMGHVYGEFIPTEDYYKSIQQHVWAFWDSSGADKQWHLLRLNVQLENGCFLHPVGGYTIDDMEDTPGEPKQIDIAGVWNDVIENYFETVPPRPFTEEPWATITIEQKIFFEDELRKEITPQNTLPGIDKSAHVLSGYECSAVCSNLHADDVLFSIHKQSGSNWSYALVHLPYSKQTNSKWPSTTFFESFDEFKFRRVYPDKADWQD